MRGPMIHPALSSSLRVRLLALVLVAVLPSLAILLHAERNHRRLLVRGVERDAQELARHVAEHHQRAVSRALGLLSALSRHPSLRRQQGAACSAELAPLLRSDREYWNLLGVNRRGEVFCSAVPLDGPVNLSDRRHVRVPLAEGLSAVGGYVPARTGMGRHVFGFGTPVRDDTGSVVAVAAASFDLAQLQEDLDALSLPDGADVLVVDPDGVVVATRPSTPGLVGQPLPPELLDAFAPGAVRELDGLDGSRRIYAFQDVAAGHEVAMRIAAGVPIEAAHGPVRRIVRDALLAFAGVAALAFAAAFLIGEVLVVRKVKAIVAAARRIAAGDPTARTGLRPGGDELGQLIDAFDEMAASVERLTRQNRLLLEAVGEGIVGIGEDGAITFVNPAAARALGWTAEEMLGRQAHALFHPRRPDGTPLRHEDCRIQAALTEESPQSGSGEVFSKRDGTTMVVDFVSTPLVDGGRAVGVVLVFKDVSERRRLEDRLRHAEKMEAVGQLAGGVAHDFNNLLTAIVSYAALVRDALPPGHASLPDVREIEAATERAAGLTRQLLAFSRRQRVAPRVVQMHQVVAGMEGMLRRVLPESVALSVVAHAPGTVFADPAQLELAILNLAVNARDAVPAGGRIEIRVFETEEGAAPGGDGELPAGPLAVLEVEDDGVGMDPATLARIFEPFFTTKPAGKGTGLGLATVHGIVAQSGGEIRVRSEPGRGSTFRVYLPRWSGAAAGPGAAPPAPPARGHETVLVVEDDAAIRALVHRSLAGAGYRVLDAGSAEAALALAEDGAAPDLLVSDVILPGRNGWELAIDLARGLPELRVLFMSGYAAQHSGQPLVPFEATLLEKPFAPDELLRRVREVLDAPARRRAGSALRSA